MLRNLRSRRRPRYGVQVCAAVSALLLLLSVSLLYSRLSTSQHPLHHQSVTSQDDVVFNPLLSDTVDFNSPEDKIDEHDTLEDQDGSTDPDDSVRGASLNFDDDDQEFDQPRASSSAYYFDHLTGSIRRSLSRRSIDEWDEDYVGFKMDFSVDDPSRTAFASDDIPVDEEVRRKASLVEGIEDALMLKMGRKVSPLRVGWSDWFDKKSEFLKRDKMFKSNLEVLNPLSNPMLQDPDGAGLTGLTRGDRMVQKWWLDQYKKVPFLIKKPLVRSDTARQLKLEGNGGGSKGSGGVDSGELNVIAGDTQMQLRGEMKGVERRTLDDNVSDDNASKALNSNASENSSNQSNVDESIDSEAHGVSEYSGNLYADGKRWGYYPGLPPMLSFSDFMNAFFRKEKCDLRVFMVWNSPPWMYSVRQQRGLESLLSNHRDACVVMFSETLELNFFKDNFVKDGFKVAVVMPNLEELLKDTPVSIFASVWFEWRETKFYSTHYSELVRLAVLYKYGGIYLDSDIIVLKPLSSLNNTVGTEDSLPESSLNGAVMAFQKHSPFIMECLKEFYVSYDDTRLRWNGADLLTRVARKFSSKENKSIKTQELKVQPSFIFFPISPRNITRYFTAPASVDEKAQQDALFQKILNESFTFHFWNSLTSALIPDPESLVTRLINQPCIRCSDVL